MWRHGRINLTVEKENLASCKHSIITQQYQTNLIKIRKVKLSGSKAGVECNGKQERLLREHWQQSKTKENPFAANLGRGPSDEGRTHTGFSTEFPFALALTGEVCSQHSTSASESQGVKDYPREKIKVEGRTIIWSDWKYQVHRTAWDSGPLRNNMTLRLLSSLKDRTFLTVLLLLLQKVVCFQSGAEGRRNEH